MPKESVKDLTLQELNEKLKDYVEEMRNLKIQTIMGQLENKKRKWFVRKKIAQIRTILHEYVLDIRVSAEGGEKGSGTGKKDMGEETEVKKPVVDKKADKKEAEEKKAGRGKKHGEKEVKKKKTKEKKAGMKNIKRKRKKGKKINNKKKKEKKDVENKAK